MYYIGKTLELMGIACLGAGLYLGCVNPFDYSESKAMGVEMGFLTLGVLIFFVGRLIEKPVIPVICQLHCTFPDTLRTVSV